MFGAVISEISDSSTGEISAQKNYNQNKRMTENFMINLSSSSNIKKNFKNLHNAEDKFLIFEHSHKQMSFLAKTFKSINNIELFSKLDEFFEKETQKNKLIFPNILFNVEAIIDQGFISTNNINNSIESSYNSNSSKKEISDMLNFLVISNIFIYDFNYLINESNLLLKRKINLLSIDFFSIIPDFKKIIIHVNNYLDETGNISISNENNIHIVFCICNILYNCYSQIKNLIVIPKSQTFYSKSKKIFLFEKMKEYYNNYSLEIYNKIGEILPFDKDEILVKLIPLSKIETKFSDIKYDKILLLSNKKIYEIPNDNIEYSKLNIIPLSRLKKINELSKSHKFQLIIDDNSMIQYSTIYCRTLINLIKEKQSNECLLDLEINRID